MAIEQTYIDIVLAGFNAEPPKADDDILQELFEAGISFSDLRATFNDIIKEKNLRLSAKDRKIKTTELLEGWTPSDDYKEILEKVALVQAELKVASTKALGAIRSWAKDNNVTLPKKPKEVKERKVGFGGHIKKILDHALVTRDITREGMVAYCKENDIPEKYATPAYNAVHFAKEWAGENASDETEGTEAAEIS